MNNEDSENEALIVDCESPRPHGGAGGAAGGESPTLFDDFGGLGPIRRRHHPRGTKRGRPRGSTRRGGGNGTALTRPASATGLNAEDATGAEPNVTNTGEGLFTPTAVPTPVKRGPGRPRIKTSGPVNQGSRGAPRTRKPIGPLVVPLGSSPAATPINRSPAMSPAPSPAHSEKGTSSTSYHPASGESAD
uniref:Uncharacterized protein n=1 Tax=Musca domestica TaxID=7370 RepID=T1PK30_MUSDO